MKALDIYLAFCFWMVFGALLEYATVSYTGKRIKLNQRRFEEFQQKVADMAADVEKYRQEQVFKGNKEFIVFLDILETCWSGFASQ